MDSRVVPMDDPKRGFFCLPLELRQQIYGMYFDTSPSPGILHVNRQIHDELIHFVRKFQRTFSINISGEKTDFDEFSQWCFKIKNYDPEISSMEHVILNIFPPDPDRPIDMWHIWNHVQKFCKEIAAGSRIPQLTVKFIENDRAKWATDGVLHSTMNLPHLKDALDGDDIGQILITICYFLQGIEKPKVILPGSYSVSQFRADEQEELMTGLLDGEDLIDQYDLMEDDIKEYLDMIKQATGRKSKALFEKKYGRVRIFDYHDLEKLKQQWPYMDELYIYERPRFRNTMEWDDWGNCWDIEVSMPDPAWGFDDSDRAKQWHQERYDPSECGIPIWQSMKSSSDWKAFFNRP